MKLIVKNTSGEEFTLHIQPDETFADLKRRVEAESGLALDLRDVSSNRKIIDENQKVVEYFAVEEVDPICSVPTCNNQKSVNSDKMYFEFPEDALRAHQWVLYCRRIGRSDKGVPLGGAGSFICSDHFKADQFVKNTTSLLKRTAVPCINPALPMYTTSVDSHRLKTPKTSPLLTCRLCALPSPNTVYIYSKKMRNSQLAEKINASLPIKVSMSDDLPKQVCYSCINELNTNAFFVELVCNTDDKLKKMYSRLSDSEEFNEKKSKGLCPLCPQGVLMAHDSNQLSSEPEEVETEAVASSESPAKPAQESGEGDEGLMFLAEQSQIAIPSPQPSSTENDTSASAPMNLEEMMTEGYEDDDDTMTYEDENTDPLENGDDGVYPCRVCGVEELEFDPALVHALSHATENFYPCTVCDNYYTTKEELSEHFIVHGPTPDENLPVTCPHCSTGFKSEIGLKRHSCGGVSRLESNAEPQLWLICPFCSKSFASEANLEIHLKTHESTGSEEGETGMTVNSKATGIIKPFACELCGKAFVRKSMLKSHTMSSHKGTAPTQCYACKYCYEAFPTTDHAVAHMDSTHLWLTPEMEDGESGDVYKYSFEMVIVSKVFICEFCEKTFAESSVLNTHRESEHSSPETPFICKWCSMEFCTYGEMTEHRSQGHDPSEAPAEYTAEHSVPAAFLCEYCDRCFFNFIKYTEHLTIHYGNEPYVCRLCSKRFNTLALVTEHRNTVHVEPEPSSTSKTPPTKDSDDCGVRPYDCHYCEKTFAIEDALVKHIRMHTGEKPFTCNVCGKGFSQSSGLNTHRKVHSDLRPFSCHLCPRTFKIKGDRDVHIRKHSGVRPFVCEFCFKAFMTQHVYSQHRKIHTGERPYRCDVCHFAFRRSHVLTVHKRIHTGEKPNVCDICGKKYRQKGDMLKHRRSQHLNVGFGKGNGESSTSTVAPTTTTSTTSASSLNVTSSEPPIF